MPTGSWPFAFPPLRRHPEFPCSKPTYADPITKRSKTIRAFKRLLRKLTSRKTSLNRPPANVTRSAVNVGLRRFHPPVAPSSETSYETNNSLIAGSKPPRFAEVIRPAVCSTAKQARTTTTSNSATRIERLNFSCLYPLHCGQSSVQPTFGA